MGGDHSAALLELRKAQELSFSEELLAPKVARALLANGKFVEVLQTYANKSIKDFTARAELDTAMAIAHARMGQNAEAEAAVSAALLAYPEFPWALVTKARMIVANGHVDEALALIDKAVLSGNSSGDAYMVRGAILGFVKRDTAGAIKAFEQAAADPLEVLGARGAIIQMQLGHDKLTEARAQLAMLHKSHPKSPQTLYWGAVVAYAAKDYGRADSIVEELLRLAPSNTRLLVLGGAASLRRGALIQAEAKLGKVVQTVERVPIARTLLAETYLRMGQPERSLLVLRPLLEQSRQDAGALALAGQAHLQLARPLEAEAMFNAAVKLRPQDVNVRTALAMTDLAKGNVDAAFDALKDIAAKDSGEAADLALISAQMRRRNFDASLAAIAKLESKHPDKPMAAHLRGLALVGKGDLVGARVSFEAALKLAPTHFSSVASLVMLDLQSNRADEARRRLDAAVKLEPKNVAARMALFDFMRRQQAKPADLLELIDDAIASAPVEIAPRIAKMQQLQRMNDTKGAALAAQNAMVVLPQSPEVLDAAGQAFAKAGDDQQALSAFNKLAGVMPKSPVPYLRIADLHAKRGDGVLVSASLRRAFEVAPESAEVHKRMLAQAANTKDYKPVLSAAKEVQMRFSKSASGFLLEGDAEAMRKAWSAALKAYQRALNFTDAVGRPQKLFHAALRSSGDNSAADRFASEWLKKNPMDSAFREYLGSDAVLNGNFAAAERYLQEAYTIEPRNSSVVNNLAWLMAERGDKDAVAMAERALALAPSAPAVLDTLAKALAGDGRPELAVDVQMKAVTAAPQRHEYRLNLVRHLIKAGRRMEALAELEIVARQGGKGDLFRTEVADLRKRLAN
jgi:putative PEP-CTERM system TPR-repeat lipoprotein